MRKKIYTSKGFTLIELLVTFGIMTAFMTALVFNQRGFTNDVSLTGQVHEASLILRQAQIYGLAVKESQKYENPTDSFSIPYGVHFERDSDRYTYFADANIDTIYNVSSPECTSNYECVEQIKFKKALKTENICQELTIGGSCFNVDKIDIVFKRPQPEAIITAYSGPSTTYPEAVIISFISPEGKIQKIRVDKAGQISIE